MPNGNDKWSQFEVKDSGDKWAQFEVKPPDATSKVTGEGISLKGAGSAALESIKNMLPPDPTGGHSIFTKEAWLGEGPRFDPSKSGIAETGREIKHEYQRSRAAGSGPLAAGASAGVVGAGSLLGVSNIREEQQAARGEGGQIIGEAAVPAAAWALSLAAPAKGATALERARLAKISDALDIGKGELKDLKTAMPKLVEHAQQSGVKTVGELGDGLKQARSQVDQKFNQGLAPIANKPTVPMSISQKIRNLITPDMSKTAEGRAQIKYIKKRAVEYEKPWTYRELNAKRMTENENLTSFYGKDTRGQAAAKLETDISKAVRDGAADTVYQAWDAANPGQDAQALKRQQGALWAMDDYVNHPSKGLLADLEARQLRHEGTGPLGRLKTHAYVSGGGPRAHLTGLGDVFSAGPMKTADASIRQAFSGQPSSAARTAIRNLPLTVLSGQQTRKTPFGTPPPPPEPEQ